MKRGDTVLLETTNGGRVVCWLIENYRPTYSATCGRVSPVGERLQSYFIVPADRIKSITPLELAD